MATRQHFLRASRRTTNTSDWTSALIRNARRRWRSRVRARSPRPNGLGSVHPPRARRFTGIGNRRQTRRVGRPTRHPFPWSKATGQESVRPNLSAIRSRVFAPSGVGWTGIVFGNAKFVATTYDGRVGTSSDGVVWSLSVGTDKIGLSKIGFGNGLFIALGNFGSGLLFVSSDGLSWERVLVGTQGGWWCIAYQDGVFVIGGMGRLLRSTDGRIWTERLSPESTTFRGIAAAGDRFVAVGSDALMLHGVSFMSKDGEEWEPMAGLERDVLTGIHGEPGRVIAVGQFGAIFGLRDGATWVQLSQGIRSHLSQAASGGGALVAVGQMGAITVSWDGGRRWESQHLASGMSLSSVAFGGGVWVAVGESGTIVRSIDAREWTAQPVGETGYLSRVIFVGGLFYAAGFRGPEVSYARIWTSSDGIQWTDRSPASGPGFQVGGLTDLIYVEDLGTFVGHDPNPTPKYPIPRNHRTAWTRCCYAPKMGWSGLV